MDLVDEYEEEIATISSLHSIRTERQQPIMPSEPAGNYGKGSHLLLPQQPSQLKKRGRPSKASASTQQQLPSASEPRLLKPPSRGDAQPSQSVPRLLEPPDHVALPQPSTGNEVLQPSTSSSQPSTDDLQPPSGSQKAIAVVIPSRPQQNETLPQDVSLPSQDKMQPALRRSPRLAIAAPPPKTA